MLNALTVRDEDTAARAASGGSGASHEGPAQLSDPEGIQGAPPLETGSLEIRTHARMTA
jgi:hypothetical protein